MFIINPYIFGAAGYTIENAIMFDGGADYLVRDPSSAGNRKTFTFSCWLKRSNLGTTGGTAGNNIFGGDRGSNFSDRLMFGNGDDGAEYLKASFHDDSSGAVQTKALYRDPTAWMNVVWVVDTTQSTDTNRVKIYVNGVSQDFDGSPSYPAEDYLTAVNNTENQGIAVRPATLTQQHFGGYMAEVIFLDGTAVSDASSFGELNNDGVWVPVDPSGLTFGTNGFHLDFKVAPGTGNGAGTDVSGNGNHFTDNSLTAAQKVTDTPTDDADDDIGNYCTWNPVCDFPSAKVSLSNGNTTATITPDGAILGTQFFDVTDSDGFYWETKFTSNISNAEHAGIGQETVPLKNTGYRDNGIATYLSDGGSEGTASGSLGTTGNRASAGTHETWQTNNDIISVAVKGGAIWFAKNNVWQDGANGGSSSATVLSEINAGTTTNAFFTGLTGFWAPMVRGHSGSATPSTTNWGATAFTYTPPTNMKRLMTANRSAPTIKNPDDGFALITLENGNTIEASLANARTGWSSFIDVYKREDGTNEDYDVRFSDDSGNSMHFNTNAAAGSELSLASGVNYSAWSWRVGSTYGCYTAEISHNNSSATNQAHGLGSGAKSAVAKRSDSTGDWYVSHPNMSSANIRFNVQEATTSELVTVDDTNVTLSTSFASGTYRVIVWKQIDGFSAFTGYAHNGSSNGPYVHLGGSASASLVAWRNIDASNSNDFFPTFTNYSTNGNSNPTDIRYNWSNGEKGSSGITIGDVTANGYKMRPSAGGAFGIGADDPMLVWAWGLRPFGGVGVAQARAR